jgi:hypothetical protein
MAKYTSERERREREEGREGGKFISEDVGIRYSYI